MPRTVYCWRCRMDLPMLTEEEWARVSPHLVGAIEQIKRYREEHQSSLAEANAKGFGREALRLYAELTGFNETNANALFHHRLSLYGPPCRNCGKLLRTPIASYCPMCGTERVATGNTTEDPHGRSANGDA
jgi:rubrerythrin